MDHCVVFKLAVPDEGTREPCSPSGVISPIRYEDGVFTLGMCYPKVHYVVYSYIQKEKHVQKCVF